MGTYTTALGDTWDNIAFNLYGSEKYAEQLMAANQRADLLEIIVFDAGTVLTLPDIDVSAESDTDVDSLPPWRTS
jgi:phage tail protein X